MVCKDFRYGLVLIGSFWKLTGKVFLGNNEFSLNVGGVNTAYVNDKTITLLNVGEGGSVLVDVDGTRDTIPSLSTGVVGLREITNRETFYSYLVAERSATIFVKGNQCEGIIATTTTSTSSSTSTTTITFADSSSIALYPLNSPSFVWDYSGNNYHGEPHASYSYSGRFSGAYYFDGNNDYIKVNNSLVSNLSQLTANVWVKANSTNTNKMRIFRVSGGNILYLDRRTDERFEVALYNNLGVQGKVTSGVAYPDNSWHNLILTYNGEQLRLFVDGAETGSPTTLYGPIQIGTNFYIGYNSIDTWNGFIDEVALWNRVLTPQEIQYLQSHPVG